MLGAFSKYCEYYVQCPNWRTLLYTLYNTQYKPHSIQRKQYRGLIHAEKFRIIFSSLSFFWALRWIFDIWAWLHFKSPWFDGRIIYFCLILLNIQVLRKYFLCIIHFYSTKKDKVTVELLNALKEHICRYSFSNGK